MVDNRVTNFASGIFVSGGVNTAVEDNYACNCSVGIVLDGASFGSVSRNLVADNYRGIVLQNSSSSNALVENVATGFTNEGIRLESNSGYNNLTANVGGTPVNGTGAGVNVLSCANVLSDNKAPGSYIYVAGTGCNADGGGNTPNPF